MKTNVLLFTVICLIIFTDVSQASNNEEAAIKASQKAFLIQSGLDKNKQEFIKFLNEEIDAPVSLMAGAYFGRTLYRKRVSFKVSPTVRMNFSFKDSYN